MALQYKQMEAVLAQLFDIRHADRKAFKARIRHLREIGVLDVPKCGKGQIIQYAESHVRELFIALLLARFGLSPLAIRDFIQRERSPLDEMCDQALDHEGPVYVAFAPALFGGSAGEMFTIGMFFGPREFVMNKVFGTIDRPVMQAIGIVNITTNLRKLNTLIEAIST